MEWIVVGLAGLLGGMLNAVAGGGSFFTLPALIFAGVPPIAANATGTAALLPGYISSAWRFRKDMELPAGLNYVTITLISVAGGSVGAVILLWTDDKIFSSLIPWLILFATAAFILGPQLIKRKQDNDEVSHDASKTSFGKILVTSIVLLVVCIYGGYFNGGLGIILLAALGLLGQVNLHGMNGIKNLISALLTIVAVVIYAAGNTIVVEHLFLLGSMAIIGGYLGAALAYKVPQNVLKGFIIAVGFVMAAIFFFK
jgi:uncharacterized membrane protein YfcA